jgi:hypothetical protein
MSNETPEMTIDEPTPNPLLTDIARRYLGIPTLEKRNSDVQDFHDLAVWNIHAALMAAFKAGYNESQAMIVVTKEPVLAAKLEK